MEIETKYSIGDTVWIIRFDFKKNEYIPDARKTMKSTREKSRLNITKVMRLL